MMNINAGEVTRADIFLVDPEEVLLVEEEIGRKYAPPNENEEVTKLALDIVSRGQLQPVQVRRLADKDNKVELVFGRRRLKAIRYINDEKLYEAVNGKKPMKVACTVTEIDDKEACLRNISENRRRANPSLVDDAYNAQTLIDKYGMTQRDVAKQFGRSDAWVSSILKLNGLPAAIQRKIHSGKISSTAAIELAAVEDTEERDKLLGELEEEGGKATKRRVIEKARKNKSNTGVRMRSAKVLRATFQRIVEDEDYSGTGTGSLAGEMVMYIDGNLSDRQILNRMEGCCKARA